MKRFHVHVSVPDLAQGIGFYSALFGQAPSVAHADYAKWMLDEPRVNFAISVRGAGVGIDHVGLQVDSDDELEALRAQLEQADTAMLAQQGAACCYARSNKYWVSDPAGVAWEAFHTLDSIPVYGEDRAQVAVQALAPSGAGACCAGAPSKPSIGAATTAATAANTATATVTADTTRATTAARDVDAVLAETPATRCCG